MATTSIPSRVSVQDSPSQEVEHPMAKVEESKVYFSILCEMGNAA